MGAILLICCGTVYHGTNQYKANLQKAESFGLSEKASYGHLKNYAQVSIQGVRLLSIPSQLSFTVMGSRILPEMSARINTLTTLDVFSNLRSTVLFHSSFSEFTGFSGIFLIVINLLVLGLGFETFQDNHYLRSLASLLSSNRFFFTIILFRAMCIIGVIFLIYTTSVAILWFQLGSITGEEIMAVAAHFIANMLMLLFFFFNGVIFRLVFRKPWAGMTAAVTFLLIMVFLFISPLHGLILRKAENIPTDSSAESKKIKLLIDFESRVEKKLGTFKKDNLKEWRKQAEYFWDKEIWKIFSLDESIEKEFSVLANQYNRMALWTPASFFVLTGNEIGGGGYSAYFQFFQYVKEMKKRFLRFWIDEVYYNQHIQVIPFITKNENLYFLSGMVPRGFLTGVAVNLGYNLLLMFAALLLLKRLLFRLEESEITALGKVDISMHQGELSPWLVRGNGFKNLLYTLLSEKNRWAGIKGFDGQIRIEDQDIQQREKEKRFFYICHPSSLPGEMRVKGYIKTFGALMDFSRKELALLSQNDDLKSIWHSPIRRLDAVQRFKMVLALLSLKKSNTYLIDDIAWGLPVDCYVDLLTIMDDLAKQDSLVIYTAIPVMVDVNLYNMKTYFVDGTAFILYLKSLRHDRQLQAGLDE